MRKLAYILFVVVLLAGCMTTRKDAKGSGIWFTNMSGETITCSVDGEPAFTVEPGKAVIVSVISGKHEWAATTGNDYWHGTVDLRLGEITDLALEKPGA
jgi:hypothetical protein